MPSNGLSAFTMAEVKMFRAEFKSGKLTTRQIAEREGVSYYTMRSIVNGLRYRDQRAVTIQIPSDLYEGISKKARSQKISPESFILSALPSILK
jgi:hypothetical protein